MIEITNEPAFIAGYHTRWHCRRCNQEVPNETEYVDYRGEHAVLRSDDLVYDAEILARISTCRLTIIIVISALVGALTVGTVDRLPSLHLATTFDDAVMDLIRGGIALFLYGCGAGILGISLNQKLTQVIQIQAFRNRLKQRHSAEAVRTG
jgi:hypothetical protein